MLSPVEKTDLPASTKSCLVIIVPVASSLGLRKDVFLQLLLLRVVFLELLLSHLEKTDLPATMNIVFLELLLFRLEKTDLPATMNIVFLELLLSHLEKTDLPAIMKSCLPGASPSP